MMKEVGPPWLKTPLGAEAHQGIVTLSQATHSEAINMDANSENVFPVNS